MGYNFEELEGYDLPLFRIKGSDVGLIRTGYSDKEKPIQEKRYHLDPMFLELPDHGIAKVCIDLTNSRSKVEFVGFYPWNDLEEEYGKSEIERRLKLVSPVVYSGIKEFDTNQAWYKMNKRFMYATPREALSALLDDHLIGK